MDLKYFTVVVADDEDELRQAVCQLVPWEELGFRLVGEAGNGLDALQLVEQLQPDLLLTDIRMPFITGTALTRQVREVQPLIQVAYLSGYDDFEFAKVAISQDVIAYLLKPISMEDLSAALKEIHEKIEARFRLLRPGTVTATDLPLTVLSLLLDTGSDITEREVRELLTAAGLKLENETDFTVLSTASGKGAPYQEIADTIDRVLEGRFSCCSVASTGQVLTLLAGATEGSEPFGNALDELYKVLCRLFGRDFTIGVSRGFQSLSEAQAACSEAVQVRRGSDESGIRYYRIDTDRRERKNAGMSALCERALHIIEQRYADESLSLADVSEELHVSPNYLSGNMKKYAGDTFINLLIKRRMEEAKLLLAPGDLRVAEVAERCGYSDQHYFSFCFKKYYGISPTKVRRGEGL